MEKRYVIVEVNYDNCPIKYMIPHKKGECMPFKCNKCGKHGDTKKQFIKKVAQAIWNHWPKEFKNNQPKEVIKNIQETQLIVAKKIVEFLGVTK